MDKDTDTDTDMDTDMELEYLCSPYGALAHVAPYGLPLRHHGASSNGDENYDIIFSKYHTPLEQHSKQQDSRIGNISIGF
jgi:hypothetical protein